ncbi:hydroxymethylbilane synthase [Clostridium luticellarii]|uniref:Porphobilinogen deaminase n=1 Tax=Clostridium luticellarii TaxID=1691940 RepID=A0A2T0BMK8_9CLOT|nr:hydroxymethylbilane synthase [Clostridium luticellarii]MCI1945255.1 hydroxymethylbilane synthase [Clostridium luticellarii]MCI1968995.1 hydroxymethylbilane synthase [Clostridium luticellarii]MCI1994588.1 hydroxymethylbilane synthase [Clostridium luticellarii]MCI2038915.1 hydroxymethylbilane synthase [Clostridium luticellarii]PRR85093.1 Porphobilinogen deaminase [Clostridium luticellarii]
MEFKIATRKSSLAQLQTEIVMGILEKNFNMKCQKVLIETTGDKRLDIALNKIGGKGLFLKEIELALLQNEADAAVHSMKDVPFDVPEDFEIAAVLEREDVRDAFVSLNNIHFEDLPVGARVGTSSNRRAAQVKLLRPDLDIVAIRGNIQTRIKKIKEQDLQGIVLAAAGIKRLKLEELVTEYFPIEKMIPAIGQGALGVEIKKQSQYKNFFTQLNDEDTRVCVEAERSFMRTLNGDCHSTIGAYARIEGNLINIIGVFMVDGRLIKKDITGSRENYMILGQKLAEDIVNS